MADTAPKTQGNEAYYATARTLGTGTTSSPAMMIWRVLDDYLIKYERAVSASELSAETGLSIEEIEQIFAQEYYQKHYGFRRFDSLEAWRAWALENGVLYNPELHRPDPEETDAEGAEGEDRQDAADGAGAAEAAGTEQTPETPEA